MGCACSSSAASSVPAASSHHRPPERETTHQLGTQGNPLVPSRDADDSSVQHTTTNTTGQPRSERASTPQQRQPSGRRQRRTIAKTDGSVHLDASNGDDSPGNITASAEANFVPYRRRVSDRREQQSHGNRLAFRRQYPAATVPFDGAARPPLLGTFPADGLQQHQSPIPSSRQSVDGEDATHQHRQGHSAVGWFEEGLSLSTPGRGPSGASARCRSDYSTPESYRLSPATLARSQVVNATQQTPSADSPQCSSLGQWLTELPPVAAAAAADGDDSASPRCHVDDDEDADGTAVGSHPPAVGNVHGRHGV